RYLPPPTRGSESESPIAATTTGAVEGGGSACASPARESTPAAASVRETRRAGPRARIGRAYHSARRTPHGPTVVNGASPQKSTPVGLTAESCVEKGSSCWYEYTWPSCAACA